MHDFSWGVIGTFSVLKGVLVAGVTAAIGTNFLQSLIVAVVSGTLGLIGMVIAATIAANATRKNREVMHDIKRKIGADQRARDEEV